ncbi:hypothetical protein [Nocardiopsis valliformis]|uniref:hypothetical protein n=1 Tax=Nocardiopsis valliformis TaxID=239974 RepID=UPI000348BE57|nr:hypothetical protein [Nocardiopsis valliformis]
MTFWKKHTPSAPALAMTLGAMALMVGTAGCGTTEEIEPSSAAAEEALPELNPDGSAPSERMTLEEAAPYLEAQGYFPAEGDLSGYEITYLPDAVEGAPYDHDANAWLIQELGEGAALPYDEEIERSWLPDIIDVDHLVDDDGRVLAAREAFTPSDVSVTVLRQEDFTGVDAYLDPEAEDGTALEEALPGGGIQELPDGTGYYNGAGALFVPEPGVVIEVLYMDEVVLDELLEHPDGIVEGHPEEVLLIVEGIEPV